MPLPTIGHCLTLLGLLFLGACGTLPQPIPAERVLPPRIQPPRGGVPVKLELTPVASSTRLSTSSIQRVRQLKFYKLAREMGVDPLSPRDRWAIKEFKRGRLYHLFFNQAATAPGTPHLIQRARKTTISYRSPSDRNPVKKTTWMVEAFRLGNGLLRRPDTHYGSFGLGNFYRREIIKELEIGIGSIDGHLRPGHWPYGSRRIFRDFGGYLENQSLYSSVRFNRSTRWNYAVDFDRTGRSSLTSRELGLHR